MIEGAGTIVLGDVGVYQIDLAAAFDGVGIVDVGAASPQRLDLGPGELNADLERTLKMIVAARLAILRDALTAGGGIAAHGADLIARCCPRAALS